MRSVIVALILGVASLGLAQDKPADTPKTETPVRVRGTLPANWKKLGLSDEQRQKILTVQAEHQVKIDRLQKEIADVRKQQRAAMEKLLTDVQKQRLRELATEKLPKTGTEDKKPDPSKPGNPK